MDKTTFQELLTSEVESYKTLLETKDNDWIVKGFIDVNKNVYTITNDTKVVSKIIEIILIPHLDAFARRNGMTLELPSAQNYYPDLTFKDGDGNLFAVDFKSSYYGDDRKVNGLTLGSYWGYFRNRSIKKSTDYPYNSYKCHLVIGMLYKQSVTNKNEKNIYNVDELEVIKSVIEKFIFFVQPKWKIASDKTGSGNTRNMGGIVDIDDLIAGNGTFASLGEDVFDDYWMNFFNAADAKKAGIGKPHYNSIETYKRYLNKKERIRKKLEK
ncbi:MAG: restriction endonuclease [Bacteroidaceae bacterium]|nr:restriction endonuclease [Bacteroidaceae bacterium]